jgi:hypothetical protein
MTNTGKIPNNIGYPSDMNKGGVVNRAVTREHSSQDEGKTFTDNYGRKYTYTSKGLIY